MKNKKIIFVASLFFIFFLSGCNKEEVEPIVNQKSVPDQEIDMSKYEKQEEQQPYDPSKLAEGLTPGGNGTSSQEENTEETESNENLEFIEKYKSATIKTNMGDIKVEFFADDSPKTVNNFLKLASEDFYDGTKFHRVIKDFMIQGGDPNSKDDDWSDDGQGGPGYKFEDEFNSHKLVHGSLAMANSGANTNGSQFFIVTTESTPHLDGKHTNFGQVVEGMDVVDKIEKVDTNENDHPKEDVVVKDVELIE